MPPLAIIRYVQVESNRAVGAPRTGAAMTADENKTPTPDRPNKRGPAPRARPKVPPVRRWTPRHLRAAALRACGKKWSEVAEDLGIHEKTAAFYSSLPGWDDLVSSQIGAQGRALIRDWFLTGLQEIHRIATASEDDKAKLKAAQTLVELAEKFGPMAGGQGGVGGGDAGGSLTVRARIRRT